MRFPSFKWQLFNKLNLYFFVNNFYFSGFCGTKEYKKISLLDQIIIIEQMRNQYKFEEQIKTMQDLFQNNITISQLTNALLDKIPHELVEKAAKELNYQYQEKYLKEDEERYQQIRMTLNIIAKDKVCNIDELFMNLGTEINNYYQYEYLQLSKKKPYKKQCRYCTEMKSNYSNGIRQHQYRCRLNPDYKDLSLVGKKIKIVDTKESYEKRQERMNGKIIQKQIKSVQKINTRMNKKNTTRVKRQEKQSTLILFCQKQNRIREKEIYDGLFDFKRSNEDLIYHSDEDQQKIKNVKNGLDIEGISTIDPTVRDFQLLVDEPQRPLKCQVDNQDEFLQ